MVLFLLDQSCGNQQLVRRVVEPNPMMWHLQKPLYTSSQDAGGPSIPLRLGRKDAPGPESEQPEGNLPGRSPSIDASHLPIPNIGASDVSIQRHVPVPGG